MWDVKRRPIIIRSAWFAAGRRIASVRAERTLDLLVLRALELQPLHAAAIAERIFQTTRGTFQIKAGSLSPALHRLEQDGWIEGEWETAPKGGRIKCP
jgi:DNA-binding PadR family transcriptional regulator